jgi:hypothetical protein
MTTLRRGNGRAYVPTHSHLQIGGHTFTCGNPKCARRSQIGPGRWLHKVYGYCCHLCKSPSQEAA